MLKDHVHEKNNLHVKKYSNEQVSYIYFMLVILVMIVFVLIFYCMIYTKPTDKDVPKL